MGCDTNVACRDCKTVYYCGYGSYGGMEKRAELFPAVEHEGHDTVRFTTDYTDERNGHLWTMSGPGDYDILFIEDFANYKDVDLTEQPTAKKEVD